LQSFVLFFLQSVFLSPLVFAAPHPYLLWHWSVLNPFVSRIVPYPAQDGMRFSGLSKCMGNCVS